MNAKAILIGLLLIATAGMAVLVTPAARAATQINDQLVQETGPTTALGGGDHVFVRFGTDAAFGVVYGTAANPNNIYIVAIKARYLGGAQVIDQQDSTVAGTLPLVRFTFHLNASLQQVDNATVPQWQVTLGQIGGGPVVTNISRLNDLTLSGKALHYDLKWDQDIEGWTFAAQNNPAATRRILLEIGAIVGNWIPAAILDAWFQSRVLARMGETGTAQFSTAAGTESANDTTGTYLLARQLQSPFVDFGGNSTRVGRFVWVSNSTVDGASAPVYGQIIAGVRFGAIGERGDAFVGFALLAGLSFLGGASIVHDPSVTTDVQADLQLPGATGLFA